MDSISVSLDGYRLTAELKNVPVAFVNALRRILLAEIPVVIVSNVRILDNTSSMTHEMLKHRVEMLPVNVTPEETGAIRDTKLELRFLPSPDPREVTSADFAIAAGPVPDVLRRDRDLDTPLLLLTLKPNQSVHIEASLAIAPTGASHVCVSTFQNHIDPDVAKADLDTMIARAGDDPAAQREAERSFRTFHIQRSFSRDKVTGRPDWFDFTVESIGVLKAKDLVRRACVILKDKVSEWVKTPILREADGVYRMETEGETFTLGQLLQELMYTGGLVESVSRDIGHPLVPVLTIRFRTKTVQPEAVVDKAKTEALMLCENVLKSL
jgi:DNA-directed RNA polymerase subunit L